MGSVNERGFLAADIQHWIEKHRRENRQLFQLCEEINSFCQRTMLGLEPHEDDGQEMLAATLYSQTLFTFQGGVIMAERGMVKQAEILLRAMLESLFALGAVANDREFVREFILDDQNQRLSLLKKVRDSDRKDLLHLVLESEAVQGSENLNEAIERLKDQIRRQRIRRITVRELAERAGLEDLYVTAYPNWSSTVHSRVRGLDDYLDTNRSGKIERIRWGPDLEDVDKALAPLADLMVRAVATMAPVFKLEIDGPTKDFLERLSALIKEQHVGRQEETGGKRTKTDPG